MKTLLNLPRRAITYLFWLAVAIIAGAFLFVMQILLILLVLSMSKIRRTADGKLEIEWPSHG